MVETCRILKFSQDFIFFFLFKAVQDFPDVHHALQLLFGKVSLVRNTSNQAWDPPDAPAARPLHVPMHARPQHAGQKVRDDDDVRPGPRPRVWWHRVLSLPQEPLPHTE